MRTGHRLRKRKGLVLMYGANGRATWNRVSDLVAAEPDAADEPDAPVGRDDEREEEDRRMSRAFWWMRMMRVLRRACWLGVSVAYVGHLVLATTTTGNGSGDSSISIPLAPSVTSVTPTLLLHSQLNHPAVPFKAPPPPVANGDDNGSAGPGAHGVVTALMADAAKSALTRVWL